MGYITKLPIDDIWWTVDGEDMLWNFKKLNPYKLTKGKIMREKFCNTCNRRTRFETTWVGSDRIPFWTFWNIVFIITTGGIWFLIYLFSRKKVNYYDVLCTECNMGERDVPDM